MWQASHLGAVDSLIIADVGSNDMDEIVEVACHEMTADDFGYRCDRRLKFVEMILVLTVEEISTKIVVPSPTRSRSIAAW